MLLSLRKNGPTSLFKEVRVFKVWVLPQKTRLAMGSLMITKLTPKQFSLCKRLNYIK